MKRVKDICLGQIDILTLKEFLSSIAIKINPELKNLIFSQRTGPNYWGNDGMTTTERRIRAVLYPRNRDITKEDVIESVRVEEVDKYDSLDQMLHDLGTECQYMFGTPTSLVRISPRTWLMTEPRLYTIYADKDRHGLVSHMPYKSLVWRVKRGNESPSYPF